MFSVDDYVFEKIIGKGSFGKVYTKSDNKIYFQDGGGTEHEIAFV